MSASDIGIVSAISVLLTLGLTIIAVRFLPVKALPVATSDQSRYLMDQVMTERETSRQLRLELDTVKAQVAQLRLENAALKLQVADLFSMMRGQGMAHSSASDAAQKVKTGQRARVATSAFSDDDVAFRDWIIRHFDGEELVVLAANAGMDKPPAGPITSMSTALVQSARRLGQAETLQREALEMRPGVPAW